MKRRFVIFLFLFFCIAIGIFSILSSPGRGPKYKGRALASWLTDLGKPESQAAARQGIIEGGTNIVSGVLEIRFAQDTRLDSFVKLIGSSIDSRFRPRREALRYRAAEALRVMGTNAAFAIVPLFATSHFLLDSSNSVSSRLALIDEQPVNQLAEVMLFDLHTNSVPAFISGLRGSNLLVRFNLCYALASKPILEVHQNADFARALIDAITPTLAAASISNPQSSPLHGPLLSMSLHALLQLGVRNQEYDQIIPQVISLLDHPESGVRYNASYFLKELAPKTEQVRNALKEALDKEKKSPNNDPTGVMMIGPRSNEVLLRGLNDALQANQQ